ncbi:MAG TPA: hypothetical protein VHV26_12540 [Rhizomicrobium sp.]|nr:hypothetical protein [Rhizomicrobium sp.]
MRKRVGKKEQVVVNTALKLVRNYQIFREDKNEGETYANDRLINFLKQKKLAVKNKGIHSAKMFGETFRPECFIQRTGEIPLCAFECKKLTDTSAKARWKEGLSQSILYSNCYKSVILIFYDYTKSDKYIKAFASKKSIESLFAASLKDAFRIHVVLIRPQW